MSRSNVLKLKRRSAINNPDEAKSIWNKVVIQNSASYNHIRSVNLPFEFISVGKYFLHLEF